MAIGASTSELCFENTKKTFTIHHIALHLVTSAFWKNFSLFFTLLCRHLANTG